MKIERKAFQNTGYLECLVGMTYFCISLHTLMTKETVTYPDYIIFVVIIISIYKISSTLYGIYTTRHKRNSIYYSLKIIDFTDALISIVISRSILQILYNADFAAESTGIFGIICSLLFVISGIIILRKKI